MKTQSYSATEFAVMRWAQDRGIYTHSTPMAQAKVLLSEVNELIAEIEAGDKTKAELEGGDVMVSLVNTLVMLDIDPRQAFYKAFKKIEPRKGSMGTDGKFHKEE